MTFSAFLLLISLVAGLYYLLKSPDKPAPEKSQLPSAARIGQSVDLAALANKIELVLEKVAHPSDILANEDFEKAVAALASEAYTIEQASNYALGANWVLSCVGYEALLRRADSEVTLDRALNAVSNTYAFPLYFLLRYVDAKTSAPVAARIVTAAKYWWSDNAPIVECAGAYLDRRIAAGEQIEFGQAFTDLDTEDQEGVRRFINALPEAIKKELNARLKHYEGRAIDRKFLASVGEFLGKEQLKDPVFDTDQILRLKQDMVGELDLASPRSILIVGPSGVGKSALRRAFARELLDAGWHVLKTSASNIIADKIYIGQIEGQIRKLAQNANAKKRVALYVDRISELSEFGQTRDNDNSVLAQLWPEIESRRMFLVTETSRNGLQALLRKYPSLPTVLKVVTMRAVDEAEAGDLAEELLDHLCEDLAPNQRDDVVSETLQLSQQYLSHKSLPGSVLSLLELAVLRARRDGDGAPDREHVLGALSQISGLPREVLDDKQQLDIEGVRGSFLSRVIGQDEAVDCLVERIAMLKAGLTDPSRPVGVFLFAGPTGTGKTEIAKALAELLFGSPEQMIRLDMSEYQDSDSIWRLLG